MFCTSTCRPEIFATAHSLSLVLCVWRCWLGSPDMHPTFALRLPSHHHWLPPILFRPLLHPTSCTMLTQWQPPSFGKKKKSKLNQSGRASARYLAFDPFPLALETNQMVWNPTAICQIICYVQGATRNPFMKSEYLLKSTVFWYGMNNFYKQRNQKFTLYSIHS